MKKVLSTLAIATAGGLLAVGITKWIGNNEKNEFETSRLASFVQISESGSRPDFVEVSELVTPTVVHILTRYESSQQDMQSFDPFGFFNFKMPSMPRSGSGSGVIMSSDGYIVTNNHVIENASKVRVVLNDKREYDATIIGTDPNTDLALLRIDEKNLPFAIIGNSDEVKVGQWVLAVGNPFNLTSTVTAGIVSAKGRNLNLLRNPNNPGSQYSIESFIQTDAAVNPGNSGGALVSAADGRLIGINTAIASQTGQYAGYSFAVPSNLMKKIMDDLLKYGSVQRGLLGVSIEDVTADLADKEGLATVRGIYIQAVNDGSAADAAGLKSKDVIVKIDDVQVNNVPELQEQIGKRSPGDKVKVTYLRNGKERETIAILKGRDGKTEVSSTERVEINKALGAEFESLTREERLNMKIQAGVRVKKMDDKSALKKAGIQPGFIITSIDKKPISTVADAKQTLESKKGGVLVEGIYPDGSKGYYAFGID
jgi:Do/DeqQ family serine protease